MPDILMIKNNLNLKHQNYYPLIKMKVKNQLIDVLYIKKS